MTEGEGSTIGGQATPHDGHRKAMELGAVATRDESVCFMERMKHSLSRLPLPHTETRLAFTAEQAGLPPVLATKVGGAGRS